MSFIERMFATPPKIGKGRRAFATVGVAIVAAFFSMVACGGGGSEGTEAAARDLSQAMGWTSACVDGDFAEAAYECNAGGPERVMKLCLAASDSVLAPEDERYEDADWEALQPACDRWDVALAGPVLLFGSEIAEARVLLREIYE